MPLSKKQTDKALKNSIKDGASYSAMDGITSTYSTPFALALGANDAQIGILNSVSNIFIAIFQRFAGKYIEKRGTKRATNNLSLIQRLVWIPIIMIPIFFLNQGVWLFIILLTLGNVALSFATTAWSSWIGSIVPENIRGRYFGKRNMIIAVFSFASTLLAGWLLGMTQGLLGFSLVFFLAFVFGLVSYFYSTKIPESEYEAEGKKSLNVLESIKKFKRYSNFKPFKTHMTLLSFAVNLASPFFTVYMLSVLKIGYQWYGIVVASELLARIVMQRYWGKLSDKFGDRTIMSLCNVLLIFYPLFFLFATNVTQLIMISIFSGIAWSGFDLTTFNYLLDVTPPEKRPEYISNYKKYIGAALFMGPLVGGFLSQSLSSTNFFWFSSLQILFLLSFILRGAVTAYGLPKIKEVRAKRVLPVTDVFMKAFAVYPIRGMTHDLIYVQNKFESIENGIKKRFKVKK